MIYPDICRKHSSSVLGASGEVVYFHMKQPINDLNSVFRSENSAGLTIQSKAGDTGASYSVQLTGRYLFTSTA